MKTLRIVNAGLLAVGCAVVLTVSLAGTGARQATGQPVAIDADDLGGVVTGPRGPEAGVWVIAETAELPTKFAKIVVTDDLGRYLVPDLPKATYNVWVRGYGLVDSPKIQSVPGKTINLTAVVAPNARAAAEYYPAGYWFSMLRVPDKNEFPGTGPAGNGIAPGMGTQAQWLRNVKSGACWACHALGTKGTRELPPNLGTFPTSAAAWERRLQSGQAGAQMISGLGQLGRERALAVFADWTDRIAAGEVPPTPPRPQGLERNVVITQWDWADPKAYLHDSVSTDRRNPSLNANGLLYGALELSADYLPVLDPVRHTISQVPLTVRDPNTPPTPPAMVQPSPYWGSDVIWTSKNNVHNPMFDERGRVWITSAVRAPENPAFCKEGSSHPSAKLFPIQRSGRHLAVYDPKTKKLTHISTCFGTHHLMFAEDAQQHALDERRRSGRRLAQHEDVRGDRRRGEVAGLDGAHHRHQRQRQARRLRRAERASRSDQGQTIWRCVLLGRSGTGRCGLGFGPRIPGRRRPDRPWREPTGDNPRGSLRAAVQQSEGTHPGVLAARRRRRPQTACSGPPSRADTSRASIAASARDRSTARRPPVSTVPEGWTLHAEPLPQLKGVTDNGSAEGSYYTWVDQFDTFGLGPEHADQYRQRLRRSAGAQGREMGRAPRAVSDRLLHEVDGRPDRRSRRRAGKGRGCGRR